jgi:hypothetical protein
MNKNKNGLAIYLKNAETELGRAGMRMHSWSEPNLTKK